MSSQCTSKRSGAIRMPRERSRSREVGSCGKSRDCTKRCATSSASLLSSYRANDSKDGNNRRKPRFVLLCTFAFLDPRARNMNSMFHAPRDPRLLLLPSPPRRNTDWVHGRDVSPFRHWQSRSHFRKFFRSVPLPSIAPSTRRSKRIFKVKPTSHAKTWSPENGSSVSLLNVGPSKPVCSYSSL